MDIRLLTFPNVYENWNEEIQDKTLILEPHAKYKTHFYVKSPNPSYKNRLKPFIGEHLVVPIFKLEEFYEFAKEEGFEHIWFDQSSVELLDRFSKLDDPYPYPLNITLKKFQLRGFNFLKNQEAEILNLSTGTGKTIIGIATANYLLKEDKVDKVVVVSRNHNKINWQRQFKFVADLESEVVDSTKGNAAMRQEARSEAYRDHQIVVINYEKFRIDKEIMSKAFKKQRTLFIFDEMPTVLKTPSSQVYKATRSVLSSCKTAYKVMLSATPVENSPEDVYACVKLLDKSIFTNLQDFRNEYGLTFNFFNPYKVDSWDRLALQELGMRISHITYQADKYKDPEIAAQFPREHWEDVFIDMSDEDRKIYDYILNEILLDGDNDRVLSSILMLQLICDNSNLINYSESDFAKELLAKKIFTDKNSAKLEKLKSLLEEIDGKIVLFNMYNDLGSRRLFEYVTSWGYKAVLYDGSAKQKQKAEDDFRHDDSVKIFVSSDKGSDSINLEKGSSVINYNLPWKYTTLIQRVNRINRLTSNHENIYYYNLLIADSIEDRKMEILNNKKNLQEDIFSGTISDHADALEELSRKDLWYILTGKREN